MPNTHWKIGYVGGIITATFSVDQSEQIRDRGGENGPACSVGTGIEFLLGKLKTLKRINQQQQTTSEQADGTTVERPLGSSTQWKRGDNERQVTENRWQQ